MEAIPNLRALLAADAGVAALVAGGGTSPPNPAIFPYLLPEQSPFPALTYQVIDLIDEQLLEGPVSGLKQMRVQVDAWGTDYDSVDALAWAVRKAMAAAPAGVGLLGANVYLYNVSPQNMIDEFAPERREFRRVLDFLLFYGDAT